AGVGGGIHYSAFVTHSTRNTIIASNTADFMGPDLFGNLGSLGQNLIGNTAGGSGYHPTDLRNIDPLLGPLQDNGRPTPPHALPEGSPAIDSGYDDDPPEWDQRGEGFPRLVNDVIDRGAFEVQLSGAPGARAGHLLAADLVAALNWRRERPDFLQRFDLP